MKNYRSSQKNLWLLKPYEELAFPRGIEPPHLDPESSALSTELREHHDNSSTSVKFSQDGCSNPQDFSPLFC